MEWFSGIISSFITGILALIGIVITNMMSNKKIEHKLEINQAITDTKLDNLSREVNEMKENNSSIQQIPVLIEKFNGLENRVKTLENK